MKKIFFMTVILAAGIIGCASAQDEKPEKVKEIGISFYNLNSFGVRYKTGCEKTLLRLNVAAMNLGFTKSNIESQDSVPNKFTNLNFGFMIGFEKRILLVKNLEFLTGLDGGMFLGYFNNDRTGTSGYEVDNITSWDISPQLELVLGLNYHIGKKFCVSAEFNPYLSYTHGEVITKTQVVPLSNENKTKYISNRINFGFSNTSASITITYVIGN